MGVQRNYEEKENIKKAFIKNRSHMKIIPSTVSKRIHRKEEEV